MKIRIITTGGTIDKIYFDAKSQFQIGEPQIEELLRQANVGVEWVLEAVLRKDSLDMTAEDRALILERVEASPESHILVTHGTDTMIETGRLLGAVKGKTVVLTGAMAPARFHITDAPFNIGCAVIALQCLPPGVYIVMNGRIFDPQHAEKNREQNRFQDSVLPDK